MSGSASAPASSGNLGPGFDTLAIALDLRCVAVAELSSKWTITEGGVSQDLPEDDLIAKAVSRAVGRPMHVTVRNEIPRARGLGSSSAVAAAAAAAAVRATGADADREVVFGIVADLEGHGDNAAAAVFGGLVAVSGRRLARLEVHPSLVMLLAVPEERLSTRRARSILGEMVPRDVVVRSLGRLSFLVEGLRTGDPTLLGRARGDELHEEPRAALSPMTARLLDAALQAGAMHAAWSGAGPAVLAVVSAEGRRRVRDAFGTVLGERGTVIEPGIDRDGLR